MGKASISINIGALWNGESTIKQVGQSLNTLTQAAKQSQNQMAVSLATTGEEWVKLGNRVQNIGKSISSFGDTLTKTITVPMTLVGGYCVTQATSFDTALASLNKTANLTSSELQSFADAALEASKTSPVTKEDILNAEALGAQLGISTDSLQDFATVATGLDIATNMGLEEASTEMARFLNIMNESDDAVSNYGSTIVALGNNYATTESEIANMAERLAGASANTKLTSQDVLGLAAAMSSLGIKAEAGGSSMTTIFNNMSSAVAAGGDQLQTYAYIAGMSAEEFAQAWGERPIEVFEQMIQNAHNMVQEGGNLTETLEAWGVSGIRQTDVMQRLINNGTILTEAVTEANTAWEENTALTTEVEKRNQSIESRFKTLQNQVNAAATEVGTVLANALLDAADDLSFIIDAVNDAATAFGDMDTPTKNVVTSLGLAAVAAGPVISALGRVVTATGKVSTKFGEFLESNGVLRASLDETDGSLIRTYASSNKLAANIGLAGNKALEAAGGVDNYVKAWEGMELNAKYVNDLSNQADNLKTQMIGLVNAGKQGTAEYAKLEQSFLDVADKIEDAQSKFESCAAEVSRCTGNFNEMDRVVGRAGESTDNLKTAVDKVKTSNKELATGVQASGSALTGLGKVAATVGADLVKSFAITAAITAVTAGITYLVEQFVAAKEKEEQLNEASQTAASIMSQAASSASGFGSAIAGIKVDADALLEKTISLNDSLGESMTEFYTSAGAVDQYVSVINELAGKSNLTATEQYRLEQAVQGLNDKTGTAYQLTDDFNVAIEEEGNLVNVNTDAINSNANAWKAQAEAKAYSAKYSEYLEAELEAEMQLQLATQELADTQQKIAQYQQEQANGVQHTAEQIQAYNEWKNSVAGLEETVAGCRTAFDSLSTSTDYLAQKAQIASLNLGTNLNNALAALPTTASSAALSMANAFSEGLASGSITEEQALSFTSALTTTLSALPSETQGYGSLAAQYLADGIASGSVNIDDAAAAIEAAATGDLSSLPQVFSSVGMECPSELAGAIRAYSSLGSNATQAMKDAIILNLTGGDVTAAAQLLGHDIDSGLAEGIQNNDTAALEAMGITSEAVVNTAREIYQTHSPSVVFNEIGANLDQGLAEGITANGSTATTAMDGVAQAVLNAVSNLPTDMFNTGTAGSSNFSTGIGSFIGSVASNAAGLFDSVVNGISGTSSSASSYGTSASSSFAAGIGSAQGATRSNADSLASAAKNMDKYRLSASTWGSHLGSNFASGIRSMWGAVAGAASSLASAVSSYLHLTEPEKGPLAGAGAHGGVTWGEHLGQNLAKGMLNSKTQVAAAAEDLAGAMSISDSAYGLSATGYGVSRAARSLQASSASLPVVNNVNNYYTLNLNGVHLNNSSASVQAALQVLVDELVTTSNMG